MEQKITFFPTTSGEVYTICTSLRIVLRSFASA